MYVVRYELIKICKQSGVRLGRLYILYGIIEILIFMLVGI